MYFLTAFIAPYLAAFNKKALKKPEQPGHEAAHSPPSPTMKQSAGSNKQTNQHSNHWFKRSNLNEREVDWTGVRVETMLRCSCPCYCLLETQKLNICRTLASLWSWLSPFCCWFLMPRDSAGPAQWSQSCMWAAPGMPGQNKTSSRYGPWSFLPV